MIDMPRPKPRVNANGPADKYSGPNEKIVEFSFPDGKGGLISFNTNGDHPVVDIYNFDPEIEIRHKRIAWVTNCQKEKSKETIAKMKSHNNRDFIIGDPRPSDCVDAKTMRSGPDPYIGIYEVFSCESS